MLHQVVTMVSKVQISSPHRGPFLANTNIPNKDRYIQHMLVIRSWRKVRRGLAHGVVDNKTKKHIIFHKTIDQQQTHTSRNNNRYTRSRESNPHFARQDVDATNSLKIHQGEMLHKILAACNHDQICVLSLRSLLGCASPHYVYMRTCRGGDAEQLKKKQRKKKLDSYYTHNAPRWWKSTCTPHRHEMAMLCLTFCWPI